MAQSSPDPQCVFCRIIAGDLPSTRVAEWDDAIAIVPLAPVTEDRFPAGEGHVLIIPKQHVADFAEDPQVTAATCRRAAEFAGKLGSCNLITSRGEEATQTVFHLHVHLVPRRAEGNLPLPWTPQKARGVNLTLDGDQLHATWAALVAMIEDIHAPQDQLTEAQWKAGEKLYHQLTAEVEKARKFESV